MLSVLSLPLVLVEVQNAFSIKPGGRFAIAVNNAEVTSPTGIGLEVDQPAEFTEVLSATIADRRWVPIDRLEFLDTRVPYWS
jgi:hypothetical protein